MDDTAFDIIKKTLLYYGLKDDDFLKEVETLFTTKVITDKSTVDDIGVAMQASPAFARRFPANKILADKGKAQYSVSQYLTLKQTSGPAFNPQGCPQTSMTQQKTSSR